MRRGHALLVAAAGLVVLGTGGSASTAASRPDLGLLQCMRAETARFLNTDADARAVRREATRDAIVAVPHIGHTTVFVWERARRGGVHRVYLVWRGYRGARGRQSGRPAAMRELRRITRHFRTTRSPAEVLFGYNTRANARALDRKCLRLARQRHSPPDVVPLHDAVALGELDAPG
jgi:hypothetical protein